MRNSRQIGVPTVPDSFHIQLHYDPVPSSSDKPGRALPLLATARGSILSLESPQPRFRVRGTKASFVKAGVDAQEAQLVAGGPDAIGQEGFAVEPREQSGTLYRAGVEPETCVHSPSPLFSLFDARAHAVASSSRRITSVPGSYASWFSNVGDALLANDPSQLIVKPEQAALVIKVIEVATQSSREGRTIDFSA